MRAKRPPCKILFLAANPDGKLSLDRELREIKTKIRATEHRDSLDLVAEGAVRPDDLLDALNRHRRRPFQRPWPQ